MGIQQKMHFESGLLRVDASGEFSLEDSKQAFREKLEVVVLHKPPRREVVIALLSM